MSDPITIFTSPVIALHARLTAPYAPDPEWRLEPFPGSPDGTPPAVWVLTPSEAHARLVEVGMDCAVVLWADEGAVERALLDDVRITAVLNPASRGASVYAALAAAARRVHMHLRMGRALEVGQALAAERDLDALLGLILTHARQSTGADGASIYTRDPDGALYFRLWQNASMPAPAHTEHVRVGDDSIAGYVARTGEPLHVTDAYALPADAPYRFNPDTDRRLGYRTRSLLTLPLKNRGNEVIGVLQLVNRKQRAGAVLRTPADVARDVIAFGKDDLAMAQALAGPAGVALENSMLYADIERLFEGFIKASVHAIETRDPTTAGHSFRVADFTERLALAVDRDDTPALRAVRFTKAQLRELRYAALLHDFGKVGVRENVLVKARKLHDHQFRLIEGRFRLARAALERHAYRELLALHELSLSDAERRRRRQGIERSLAEQLLRLREHFDAVCLAVEPSVLPEQASAALAAAATFVFPGEDDAPQPLLDEYEFADLSLSQGSLNARERAEIESHVSHTYAFLRLIPWTRDLANLPDIAYAHHEKLDGSGYPRRLARDAIPVQSRIMTIADIYDALIAPDRPYKRAVPPELALDILTAEARAGKVDAALLQAFVESRAWRPNTPGAAA
jgi:HD-GYP domain-containing protein (c-di-GMP phosphodiesterase class II)